MAVEAPRMEDRMSKPPRCDHDNTERIREAQFVYGIPGHFFARYRCVDCRVEWDDPTELPVSSSVEWDQTSGKRSLS